MELDEVLRRRRSVRSFSPQDVEPEKVEALQWAAERAPSAGGLNARHFVVVRDRETKRRLREAALDQSFVEEAPVVIVCCCDLKRIRPYGRRGVELYTIQDVAASAENILLKAVDLGLGGVWVGAFREEEVKRILSLPPHLRPTAMICVGYPAQP
ncbi:MAG: nitroreductase family protein [Thermoplasmata archaeon]|nr:MAG: nitroreductase family protein [Thermoplasmata archaeon]RLF74311.1 MAG: nitroreductase family protein [Thermoplasmata archaeon]